MEAATMTQRHASVVATVIQWLGTNVGSGFLQECLRRVGEHIQVDYKTRPENQYYVTADASHQRVRLPSAWYNFAGRHAFDKLAALPDYRLPTHDVALARGTLVPEARLLNARPKLFVEAVYRQQAYGVTTPAFRALLAKRTEALARRTDAVIKVRLFAAASVPLDIETRNLARGELPDLSLHYRQHLTTNQRRTVTDGQESIDARS
jgi:hypothetical protein